MSGMREIENRLACAERTKSNVIRKPRNSSIFWSARNRILRRTHGYRAAFDSHEAARPERLERPRLRFQ
jgi:hypothetical protein